MPEPLEKNQDPEPEPLGKKIWSRSLSSKIIMRLPNPANLYISLEI